MQRPGAGVALAAVLLAGLALRLWSIDHGLPFVFNPDEELHFVPVAVGMFEGSLNPGYFENPSAFTCLLFLTFKLRFAAGLPFGPSDLARELAGDPEAVYLTARLLVAGIGTLVAALVFWAGRRLHDARVGLFAAALVAVAFLPVFYSKHALNDVVALAPITIALVGCLAVLERGRPLDWALAGGAVGMATATKYTAGAMVATVIVAGALRIAGRPDRARGALLGLALAGLCCAIAFLVLNPYAVLDFQEFRRQVGGQSAQAGGAAKLGQADVPGWRCYAWTLTWGLGRVPAIAAAAGAVLALRADVRRGLLLVTMPLLLLAFLGSQARFFARWLLPAYPMLAILAALATVRAVDALAVRPRRRPALLGGGGGRAPPRPGARLERARGRRARAHRHPGAGPRVARAQRPGRLADRRRALPPEGFLTTGGRSAPPRYRPFPVPCPFQLDERRLRPSLVDGYRRAGYCWVVVASTQKDRGLAAGLPGARAYYRRLEAASSARVEFSPYRPGAAARIQLRPLLQLPAGRIPAARTGRGRAPPARLPLPPDAPGARTGARIDVILLSAL